MQVHFGTELLHAEWTQAVGCVGTFDGVHLGHREVIRQAASSALHQELPSVLFTFDRHPLSVLHPDRCPKAIASLDDNLQQFRALGISVAVVLQFDAKLSRMSAERFLREVLIGSGKVESLVVGHDFAMGNDREGNIDWLKSRFPTRVVEPFKVEEVRVSSSAIRQAIQAGELDTVTRFMGRPFLIHGVVVGGNRLGRELGFPTINLARSFDQVLLPDGVYVSDAITKLGTYRAALAIGMRPAVGGKHRTIEAFLLDYPGESLYGTTVSLQVHRWIREEQNFASLEDLKSQMNLDVIQVREFASASSKLF